MKTETERTEDNVAEEPEVIENQSAPNTSKIEVNEEEPPREKVKAKTKSRTLKHPKIIGIEIDSIDSVFVKIYISTLGSLQTLSLRIQKFVWTGIVWFSFDLCFAM